jgi:hypothetical protein
MARIVRMWHTDSSNGQRRLLNEYDVPGFAPTGFPQPDAIDVESGRKVYVINPWTLVFADEVDWTID